MTPSLPLDHELEAEWRFRIIHERNFHGSMEMSFLSHSLYVVQFQAPINRGTDHRAV